MSDNEIAAKHIGVGFMSDGWVCTWHQSFGEFVLVEWTRNMQVADNVPGRTVHAKVRTWYRLGESVSGENP